MAYVIERKGFWFAGYTDHHGRRKKVKKKYPVGLLKDKKAAQREADELEFNADQARKGLISAPSAPKKFSAVVARYLEVDAAALRSFTDIKRRLENHILPTLGEKYLTEILPADIQALLNKKAPELGPQSRQHLLNHISAVYSFAIRSLKACKENPVLEVDDVFIPPRPPKVIPPEVVMAIIRHVPDRWRGLFAVAAYSGLRKGELLGLLVENVDLRNMVITVEHSYEGPTKGGKERYLPIAPDLVPYLKVELGRARSRWLFPALHGGMQNRNANLPRTMRNAMKAANVVIGYDHKCRRKGCGFVERRADDAWSQCPKCGFALHPKRIPPDWSLKDLRSTCATMSYEATGDIRFVKELLGHSDVKVTEERYAKMRSAWMGTQAAKLKFSESPYSLPSENEASTTNRQDRKNEPKIIRLRSEEYGT